MPFTLAAAIVRGIQGGIGMTDHAEDAAQAFRWEFANVEFDEARWELRVGGESVELERKPLEVLAYLLRHAGEVVTKDELLEAAWPGRIVVEAALTNAIGKLRKALGEATGQALVTVPRVGYRLDAAVVCRTARVLPTLSLTLGDAVPRRPHWRLIESLARHDDSEVWRAEHAKTRENRVFKFSLDGRRLPALKREVTLARLLQDALGERDDFVRVIDWDFAEAPYFLEASYGGIALDAWAQSPGRWEQWSRADRVAMMAAIADAVASAHELGILHKDLKPANVLVHGEAGAWRPRVADFGSGRVFEPGHLNALGITQLGLTQTQAITGDSQTGTPLYLAPEVLLGHAPSIKSDLYALGVMLYQTLVGDFRRSLAPGWEATIDDPLLREDIAAFAEGDPDRRPSSARDLAHRLRTLDARRVARDTEQAVKERIALSERRLAKVRARRPWMIAAMVLLTTGLITTASLYRQSRQAQIEAMTQRDVAQTLNRFVNRDILGAADPFNTAQGELTMRQALDRASPSIQARFGNRPRLSGPMHQTVASAYYQLSDYGAAATHFRRAAADMQLVEGALSADALALESLALEAHVRGGKDVSLAAFQALDKRIRALPAASQALAWIYLDRARAWEALSEGDATRALSFLDHASSQMARVPDLDPDLEATIQQAWVIAGAHAGLPTKLLLERQRAALDSHGVSDSNRKMSMALSARYALARVRMIAGEERLMESEYRDLVTALIQQMGPRHEATLLAQHGLAHIYFKQGRWNECAHLARRTEASMGEVLGRRHANTISSANTRASCLLGEGRHAEAAAILESALTATKDESGAKSRLIRAVLQLNLAHASAAGADWRRVKGLLSSIRKDGEKLIQFDSDAEGEVVLLEGQLSAANGDMETARQHLEKAVSLLRKKNPGDYWLVLIGERALANLPRRTS